MTLSTTSRRAGMLVAACAAAFLTLAACSTAADNTAADSPSTSDSAGETVEEVEPAEPSEASDASETVPAGEDAAAPSGYPITVTTQYGDVTIPTAPERVVALSATAADELLSLGVEPIAVATDPATIADYYPWLGTTIDDVADASLVSASSEINLEAIAQFQPDLIVGATYQFTDQAIFDQINSIAPTVIPDSTALNVNWDARLLSVAAALDKTADAEGIIDRVRAEFAEIGSAVPGIDAMTYQFVRVDPDGYGFGNGSVLDMFGLKPAANQDNTQNGPVLSKENTSQLDADLLGVWAPTDDLRAGLDNDPLFQALPAVESGNVFYTDMALAIATNTPAPMALSWVKETLSPVIAALG